MDVRKKSQIQEKRVANELGGKVTPASGALWGAKGDVKSDLFLAECKTTEKPAYPLTLKTWTKISKEALKENFRLPVMSIDLCDGKDKMAVVDYYDIAESKLFKELCRQLESLYVDKKQFMIHSQPMIVEWALSGGKLAVLKWSDFLECMEEFNNEQR